VALYPDSLGYIFSGSAVVDKNNTSGFGINGQPPMVAIFTQHDPKREKAGRSDFQRQSIAYSIDNGKTWTKYAKNPVLKNPGITDFRDPKVMWYEPAKKWVMTLATKDRISFYSSPNLKNWKKESEFGSDMGAHNGVWECPDLFPLSDGGNTVWVLIVSVNPGAPNGGSGTQYFLGWFDGKTFKAYNNTTKWIDYGPDDYAGITWSNTGSRKIFLGWMSNWIYANQVPSGRWRNAMTIPRELRLKHAGPELFLASTPVAELKKIGSMPAFPDAGLADKHAALSEKIQQINTPCRIDLQFGKLSDFVLTLSNTAGEELSLGYDGQLNQFFIDRSRSGRTDFNNQFSGRHVAPRLAATQACGITLIIDNSSIELFADDGLTVMTELCFPGMPYNQMHFKSATPVSLDKMEYTRYRSIWK